MQMLQIKHTLAYQTIYRLQNKINIKFKQATK